MQRGGETEHIIFTLEFGSTVSETSIVSAALAVARDKRGNLVFFL